MLSLFEFIKNSSSLSMEEIEFVAFVNGIFQELDFLGGLFMMSFKYGLILLRCPLTDNV